MRCGWLRQVFVHAAVEQYIVRLTRATRAHPSVQLGVSPRGSLALYHAAQAWAAIHSRDYVLPDDVKQLIHPVLGHRVITTSQARVRGHAIDEILREIAAKVPVPVEESWSVEAATS